jgi:hypothetical protein
VRREAEDERHLDPDTNHLLEHANALAQLVVLLLQLFDQIVAQRRHAA